jgi:hypothetical protein
VTVPRGEKRFRFFQAFSLDPPVLDTRDQHRRGETSWSAAALLVFLRQAFFKSEGESNNEQIDRT